jgi:O-antigen/teichoic acid export membrane protein
VFSVDALVRASMALLIPVYLKLMTQAEFGLFSYLLNAAGTVALVINFGLYVPQTKLYHDCAGEEERGRLLFTIAALLGGLLVVTLGLTYACGLDRRVVAVLVRVPFDYPAYRSWLLATMLVSVAALMLFNFFVASEQIRLMQRYNIFKLLGVHGVVLALLVYLNQDPILVRLKYATLVEGCLVLAFGTFYYVRRMRPSFHVPLARRALKIALPIELSALLGVVINFGDRFFLEKYGTTTDLSVYYLAISVSSILPLVVASLQNIWLPLFLKEKDLAANVAKTRRLARLVMVGSLVVALGIMVAMKLAVVFGVISVKYAAVLPILPIVLLTQMVTALVPVYGNYLIYFEKTQVQVVVGVAVGIVGIAVNILLTARFRTYGAALSSLICNLAYLGAYYVLIAHYVRQRLALVAQEESREA